MNKNLLKAGIGLIVGGSLLITSTVLSMAGGPSGYEALKSAVKNSKTIENATLNVSGSVADNDKELIKVKSTFKADEKQHSYSGVISLKSDKSNKAYTLFGNEEQMIFKDDASQVYNKVECNMEAKGKRFHKRINSYEQKQNPQVEKIGEKILDTLVGDLKKKVELKNLDNGEKKISIALDKNEIPSLVNLMLSVKGQNECDKADKMHEILGINIEDYKAPELVSDIKAEKVDAQIVIDKNNIIKELDAEFDITGNDAENKAHNQDLKVKIDVSDINSTKVDSIKLDGKNVKTITREDME
ncbi:MAG: hypothetical protein Q8942_10595 [Bacillota bacterium]|nr:hypothetical protein [Bacillota bacterium]